ncbi:protein-disulfide reductase DsbD [Nevskia soli]|uniref:protein-disulfide reductase DsbD n=1 Tax=Nevskia soli TaxID=418856 RepID=UPI00056271BD|nr:protein-disulfide reductase DsbD [Nevskia soli]
MEESWLKSALTALCGVLALAATVAWAEDFLDVDKAFVLAAAPSGDGVLELKFDVAPGYHLYRERLSLELLPPDLHLVPTSMPDGEMVHDDSFGRDVEVYRGQLALRVALASKTPADHTALLRVGYQGCADAGLCYPPQTRVIQLHLGPLGQVTSIAIADQAAMGGASAQGTTNPDEPRSGSRVQNALRSGHLLSIASVFLVAGLLLSFTPCVLPMVPILSSIIVGHGVNVGRRKGFTLALSYALGMALVYTIFGIIAGLLGEGLAASLQNPWVLGSFGLLMVGLALSMFGLYELQLPSALQTRLTLASGRFKGGNGVGVFLMGGVSALIVGPCVAAPLAGALVYISQTRDVVIGGLALFSLAAGMSVPLLLVGLSAGALLPRAGAWMLSVKTTFGVVLLGVAWWLVSPVLPPAAAMLLLAALLALAAGLLGAFSGLDRQAGIGRVAGKAGGWILACMAVAEVAGALAGADSVWQPLQPLVAHAAAQQTLATPASAMRFAPISSTSALDEALRTAGGRPVVLDFYADWCVSCKEMEHSTFADPLVRQRLEHAVLLQADVTANTEEQRALLKRFGLFGPPSVLFFDAQGREKDDARVIGFEAAPIFIEHLDAGNVR